MSAAEAADRFEGKMMESVLNNMTVEGKAQILVDSLPYIRDFNQKIIVVCYSCSNLLSDEQEKDVMRDIALLKSIGMKPILVHDSRMGHDKFRENKRLAKLIELCGIKAVGICGFDYQTLHMTLENNYIPVVTPNDIDTEDTPISPEEAAVQIALAMKAEKVLFMGKEDGIHDPETGKIISQMTIGEVMALRSAGHCDAPEKARLRVKVDYALQLLQQGIPRVHIISGQMAHAMVIEIFSVIGIGTVIMEDREHYYPHELLVHRKRG